MGKLIRKMGLLTPVLFLSVSSVFSSLPPAPGVLCNCVVENWGNGKDTAGPCILCFTANQHIFVERAMGCSELFLPPSHKVCSGELAAAVERNQESVEDVLG